MPSQRHRSTNDLERGKQTEITVTCSIKGNDLTVRGTSVVSDNKTTLITSNNIAIEAEQNFETSSTFREEKKSVLMSSGGGIGFTDGSKQQNTHQQNIPTSASARTVGSIAGNVTATAGNAYTSRWAAMC